MVQLGARSAQVCVKLSDGRVVQRSQNPNVLRIDGREVAPDEASNYLGLGFEAWAQVVHHAQSQPMFADLSPADRAELLSTLLGLGVWDARAEQARADARTLSASEAALRTELSRAEGQLAAHQQAEQTAQAAFDRVAQQRAAMQRDLEAERAEVASRLQSLRTAHQEAVKHVRQASRAVLRTKQAWEQVHSELEAARQEEQKLNGTLRYELAVRIQAEKGYDAVGRLGTVCHTCHQPISAEHVARERDHYRDRLKAAQESEAAAQAAVDKFHTETTAPLLERDPVAAQSYQDAQRAERAAAQEETRIKTNLDSTERELFRINSAAQRLPEPDTKPLEAARARIAQTLNLIEVKGAALVEVQVKLKHAEFWGKQFVLLRLWAMEQRLQEMNLLSEQYLRALGLSGWRLNWTTQRVGSTGNIQQRLFLEVQADYKDALPIETFSGGERTRVCLAAQLALARIADRHCTFGFEFWDEPSSYLSGRGLEDWIEELSARAHQERRVIYMIDHNAPAFAYDGVLTLTRTLEGVTASWGSASPS